MSSSKQQATALKYAIDKENSAPVVVASGSGTIAQKIIDIAIENNVPVYQDDSLATLLAQLKVGNEIPPSLFQAIVDLYVYFLNYNLDENVPAQITKSLKNTNINNPPDNKAEKQQIISVSDEELDSDEDFVAF